MVASFVKMDDLLGSDQSVSTVSWLSAETSHNVWVRVGWSNPQAYSKAFLSLAKWIGYGKVKDENDIEYRENNTLWSAVNQFLCVRYWLTNMAPSMAKGQHYQVERSKCSANIYSGIVRINCIIHTRWQYHEYIYALDVYHTGSLPYFERLSTIYSSSELSYKVWQNIRFGYVQPSFFPK